MVSYRTKVNVFRGMFVLDVMGVCEHAETCGLLTLQRTTVAAKTAPCRKKRRKKHVKHIYTYCNLCLDLSSTVLRIPSLTFKLPYNTERHFSTSFFYFFLTYSCLPLSVNFSIDCILFSVIQYISSCQLSCFCEVLISAV